MRRLLPILLLLPVLTLAQSPTQPSAAKIKLKLNKLNFLGSVLYVAAHPDDENTRIITYLSNDRLAATAYLSMTRGDGGQNLIGPEIRDLLGLIRTQELLAARRIDGGRQFFTRANDFGFSKSADETLQIWGKDNILSDVVKVFREYQPDVIITRFPPTEQAGHGHHTSSAMLAIEAFDVAADAGAYPQHLKTSSVWQVKRLFINTGRWWNNTINENTPGVITLDVGGYSPLLGESYSEIAAVSRSQHKSQGFGSRGTRGYQPEFLEFVKGEKAEKDIFEGVNTTWSRLKGGDKIQPMVTALISQFNPEKPSASVPALLQLRNAVSKLPSSVWRDRKLEEVNSLIQDCLGLYAEVTADSYWGSPGHDVTLSFEFTNRSDVAVTLTQLSSKQASIDSALTITLKNNVPLVFRSRAKVSASYSDPYWLREPHSQGLFTVNDPDMIGKPENDAAVSVTASATVAGEPVSLNLPVVFKWTDPVKGEQYRPFEIVPPVLVNLAEPVMIFADDAPRKIKVNVKAAVDGNQEGTITLKLPAGWKSVPLSAPFTLGKRNQEATVEFAVTPSHQEITTTLEAVATVGARTYNQSIQLISYDHIPTQTLLPRAEAKVVRMNLRKEGGVVGYISGAGDDIPAALRNMGYEVWEMKNDEVTADNLSRVDAVVLGVRALNTNERIGFLMPTLLKYAESGGTVVVQYNTNFGMETSGFAPYPITISRDRVTEEDAEVRILQPNHALLNYPNKITSADFDGWVQERGLYFPNKWDEHYTALLSMNDKGEEAKDGSLLVADFGKGHFVYTGLSFFRELPEGVPGAYKLFANLVSMGKQTKPASAKVNKSK